MKDPRVLTHSPPLHRPENFAFLGALLKRSNYSYTPPNLEACSSPEENLQQISTQNASLQQCPEAKVNNFVFLWDLTKE